MNWCRISKMVRSSSVTSRSSSVFFFSSRRRHTRLQGDWSSDVCSSDLFARVLNGEQDRAIELLKQYNAANPGHLFQRGGNVHWWWRGLQSNPRFRERSEERRVGKECRSRWSPYH